MKLSTLIIEGADKVSKRFHDAPLDPDEVDAVAEFFKVRISYKQGHITIKKYEHEVRAFALWFT